LLTPRSTALNPSRQPTAVPLARTPLTLPRLALTLLAITLLGVLALPARSVSAAVPVGASKAIAASPGCRQTTAASTTAASTTAPGTTVPGTTQTLTYQDGSVAGSFDLTVPRSYRPHRPTTLVFLFYGSGSNPAAFSTTTDFPALGAAQGDIVVVPQIQPNESEWQFSGHGSDAAFITALDTHLQATYCIAPRRVFAAGFSAGAAFSIIYGCSHQRDIRAISTVAVDFQLGCTRPMPILAFHGTADPAVPYQNGAVGISLPGTKVRGTLLNMGDWAKLDRCRAVPVSVRAGSQVSRSQWPRCTRGTSVTLYTVLGGGHDWPGADPKYGFGLTTQQISASRLIVRFFSTLQ
jgi:polyhydroxybutyrate depolymerase